ncbi:hypothetical protein ANCCAN_29160 [Ancylostoma caninum]|uniref:DDE Tnp4 domain-containing protein n=1 Tax=Ancylostoma caninum TaxID=29170 RepID=A0A368F282_ANCCA|nr:hypothetical protein ANCCAN_29160 [Ancylostoma caninum]
MSDELRDDECIAALEGLLVLLGEGRRCYVDEGNVPHLDTRFRIFDSYLASLSPRKFHELTRLYPQEFEVLHSRLATNLEHYETHRSPVTTRHRLYVGHTESFVQMGGEFALGTSTACNVVHEVASAIIDVFHDEAFPLPVRSTWEKSADLFRTKWDYPAAVGALDGKHVEIVCPPNSGSLFYNYKNFHSIVLLALVDANYSCLLYDLGELKFT